MNTAKRLALSLGLMTLLFGCGRSDQDYLTSKKYTDTITLENSIDTRCLIASGDVAAKSLREGLTPQGVSSPTYANLFRNYAQCAAADVSCLVDASGDIVLERFKSKLTAPGINFYADLIRKYNRCAYSEIECTIPATAEIAAQSLRNDLPMHVINQLRDLLEGPGKCGNNLNCIVSATARINAKIFEYELTEQGRREYRHFFDNVNHHCY